MDHRLSLAEKWQQLLLTMQDEFDALLRDISRVNPENDIHPVKKVIAHHLGQLRESTIVLGHVLDMYQTGSLDGLVFLKLAQWT